MIYGNRKINCKKIRYGRKAAEEALKIAKNSHKKWRKEIRMYECPDCGYFHLTSLEEFEEQEDVELVNKNLWNKLLNKDPP